MRGLLAASLVLVVVSCDGPSGSDAGDALDATLDTSWDGGRDGGRDARAPDAPRDAGDLTTWTRIARSLPEWCTLERADHPELLADVQLVWTPCTERDNCLRTAPLGGGLNARWLSISDGYVLGQYEDLTRREHIVIVPLDGGPPVAVFRSNGVAEDPGCSLRTGDLGEGRAALAVRLYDTGGIHGAAYFVSPIAEAGSIDEPTVDDREHYDVDFPQELYVSATALLSEVQPINLLFSVEDGLHVPIFVDADFSAGYGQEYVFGDTVLWTAWGEPPYIAQGNANLSGGSPYFSQAPWRISHLWTDGVDMAWLSTLDERDAGGIVIRTTHEIWTSPYAATPAGMTPRRVREVRQWGHPLASSTLWVTATWLGEPGTRRIEIYDLDDGRMRVFETPGTTGTADSPLLVSPERIIYSFPGSLIQFDPRLVPYTVE
jgi:hypothetical protein